jgi:uncharacterized protein (UPF0147 family)
MDDLDLVIKKIEELAEDPELSRKVTDALKIVNNELTNKNQDLAVRITTAIYDLERIASSINTPMHTKMELWDVIGKLESMKRED